MELYERMGVMKTCQLNEWTEIEWIVLFLFFVSDKIQGLFGSQLN